MTRSQFKYPILRRLPTPSPPQGTRPHLTQKLLRRYLGGAAPSPRSAPGLVYAGDPAKG